MYSLHSWVGLTAVILFGLQWVFGFVSFLFPKLSDGLRATYLPHHKFWGIAIFVLVCAAALMGITEKAFFTLPK
jgi:cytochrome b-561